MKLTEEEYTDLVQKRLGYKLTFEDYCRLEEDIMLKNKSIDFTFTEG